MAGLQLESMDRESSCTLADNQELNLAINLSSWSGLFLKIWSSCFYGENEYIHRWCLMLWGLESNGEVGKEIGIFKITCNKITRKEKIFFWGYVALI